MASAGNRSRRSTGRRSNDVSSDWIYGFHPVREALRAGRRRLECLWLRAGSARADHDELSTLARDAGIPVEIVERAAIDELAGSEAQTQGVALRAGPIPELSLDELIAYVGSRRNSGGGQIVALDGVKDPQNVGALARVAESAGADGLVLTERRAPELTPAVSRASAGAVEWLRVARVPNLGRALSSLKEAGFWIVAAAPENGACLFEIEDRLLTGNLVVVLGAESKGIRPGVLKLADHEVAIPMRGNVASLNVSTAGAIILYDLLRRSIR
ncbi:MAG: 23S rRNA (guanosine(2251)-2'-O)-methyltransferase RlmB [bacterium]|nr:23S rRNA (guanosine(2251)-2'-O)-methyltransferase RlmB [Deltaproteobacteria bacterium]MCP4907493.1 23S rRNA (guanosine(2251)-2'-O)-methyltransferase RlmB [bacterium]